MNKELLQKAAKVLIPVGVFLRNSKVYTHPGFHPHLEQKDLQVQYKARHLSEFKLMLDEDKENGVVAFQYEAGVRLVDDSVDEKDDKFIQIEIVATFTSEYQLTEASAFEEDAMSEFLNHNVRFHVWPFWREYLQSTGTRMGLPVIPLPHHFHPQATEKED